MTINLEKALEVVKDTCKLDACKIAFDQLEMEVDKDRLLEYYLVLRMVNFVNFDS